jgi:hypothetical protein
VIYSRLKDEHGIDVWADSPTVKNRKGADKDQATDFDIDNVVKQLEKYKRNADEIIEGVLDGEFPRY